MSGIAVIILAAGSSSRLGKPKQLLTSGSTTLIRTACLTAIEAALGPVIVVVGSGAKPIARELRGLTVRTVVNDRWYEGMASSIRSGIAKVPAACVACVIMTCDQPAVTSAHLRSLAAAAVASDAGIAASHYAGTGGVPACFSRDHFAQLLLLTGDHGAKAMIQRTAGTILIDLPAGEQDVDRPADASGLDLH